MNNNLVIEIADAPGYLINTKGVVFNAKRSMFPRTRINSEGYELVSLQVNGVQETKSIHRLVAIAFIANPLKLPQVNHKDGIKTNNDVLNLEWMSAKENMQHAVAHALHKSGDASVSSKLTAAQVAVIKELLSDGFPIPEIAMQVNVDRGTIYSIYANDSWVHVPWLRPPPLIKAATGVEKASSVLNETKVNLIKNLIKEGSSNSESAKQFSVHRSSIRAIRIGKNWSHVSA